MNGALEGEAIGAYLVVYDWHGMAFPAEMWQHKGEAWAFKCLVSWGPLIQAQEHSPDN